MKNVHFLLFCSILNVKKIVLQALKSDMVSFLVSLLEKPLHDTPNPAATKAQIAKALQAMLRSLKYGEEVSEREGSHLTIISALSFIFMIATKFNPYNTEICVYQPTYQRFFSISNHYNFAT